MLTVSTAAATTALTTRATAKTRLEITDTSEDYYLDALLAGVSSVISTYLNIVPASDGTRTLGRETLVHTFRNISGTGLKSIMLARYPVTSITSVYEDGVLTDPTLYEVDGATGIVTKLDSAGDPTRWCFRKCVVTFVAGWKLPGDTGRTLPQDIEEAALDLIKAVRASRTRDPSLRSENILSGLYSYTLFDSSSSTQSIPASIATVLDGYRNVSV